MNKYVMHYKIGSPISHNTQSDRKSSPKAFVTPKIKASHTHYCIENKECIVAFKPTVVVFVVVVLM
jgi:hypothetical protein